MTEKHVPPVQFSFKFSVKNGEVTNVKYAISGGSFDEAIVDRVTEAMEEFRQRISEIFNLPLETEE